MTFQAVATLSNRESLCICEITDHEADIARQDNPEFDQFGLYLIAVDREDLKAPGRVLAKFASEDAAKSLAKFFRLHGTLETA
ncbi:hypothetical protein [Mesorhizobium sp. M0276]|uniref:hypothetical protein n=1 Tax=Mesorhizobium sp. M0276 TaxID=2956928 RepID=UPI003335E052